MRYLKRRHSLAIVSVLAANFLFARSHSVKRGETFYSISRKYGVSVEEIREANEFPRDYILKSGEVLVIPENSNEKEFEVKNVVCVQKGNTLYSIARENNVRLTDLLALNNLKATDVIYVGQRIKIPGEKNIAKINRSQTEHEKRPQSKHEKKIDEQKINIGSNMEGRLWPLEEPVVRKLTGRMGGVELVGKAKENVLSLTSGIVMYASAYHGLGNVVIVTSSSGLVYTYTGLASISVSTGTKIKAGEVLGKSSDGASSSIKFMVFKNGKPLDPSLAPRG